MPIIIKRLLDISTYYEKKYCDKVTSTTYVLQKIYNELFSKEADIRYNLFNNFNINFDFFDDFNKSIYGKIILLIFISFLISKIIHIIK